MGIAVSLLEDVVKDTDNPINVGFPSYYDASNVKELSNGSSNVWKSIPMRLIFI